MEHQSETSTESCSLPPTPGKGVCDTDNDTEQYTGAQEDKLIEERSLVIGGGKSVGEPAKVQNEVPMLLLSHNGSLCREFLEDQGKDNNFTDLDLICCDGYMQVHRCVLMGASKFLRDLMIDKVFYSEILDSRQAKMSDSKYIPIEIFSQTVVLNCSRTSWIQLQLLFQTSVYDICAWYWGFCTLETH